MMLTGFGKKRFKPMLIGEAPEPGISPNRPLSCRTFNSIGHKLRLQMGITANEYENTFIRVNLFKYRFNKREAKEKAETLQQSFKSQDIFLIGRNTAYGFNLTCIQFFRPIKRSSATLWVIPISPWYDDPYNNTLSKNFWKWYFKPKESSIC